MRLRFLAVVLTSSTVGGCLCGQIPDFSQNFDAGGGGPDASIDAGVDAGPDGGLGDSGLDGGDGGSADCTLDGGDAVAYWALNEGSGTFVGDLTGNGNNGQFANWKDGGALPAWTTGMYCGGLAFDSDGGYVDFGDAGDLALTGSMTVSAWVKLGMLPPPPDGGHDLPIVSKRGAPQRGWELYLDGADGSAVFDVAIDATGAYVRQYGNGTNDGQWHHLVGVYDANARTLATYVDGVGSFTDAGVPSSQFNSPHPVHIGASGDCTSSCVRVFNGLIDEVRIYNRALPSAEVLALP